MENNEQKKVGRNFGFTQLKTTEEKLEDNQKPSVKKAIEGGEVIKISPAVEKLRAMQQYGLKVDMVTVSGQIPYPDYENFEDILRALKKEDRHKDVEKRHGWSHKKLVAHFVLEGMKDYLKKINK